LSSESSSGRARRLRALFRKLAISGLFLAALNSAANPIVPAFHGAIVPDGVEIQLLRLRDVQGRLRPMSDFRGRVVALFFGFTQCADICPGELTRLKMLLGTLGSDATMLQVLFITLDPERDSSAVLGGYVNAFDSRIVALRGNPADIARAAREFRVYHRKIAGSSPGRYTIDHSGYLYLVDAEGRLRLKVPPDQPIDKIADDVRILLKGSGS
jgi:protein SCO1/2